MIRPGPAYTVFDGRMALARFPNLVDAIAYAKANGGKTIRIGGAVVWPENKIGGKR